MADPQSSQEDTPQLESLTLGELAFLSAFRTLPPEVQQALMEGLRRDDPKPLRPFRDQPIIVACASSAGAPKPPSLQERITHKHRHPIDPRPSAPIRADGIS